MHGAERVDTCFNGLGERAGNAATEDVVMAIRTRRERPRSGREAWTRRRSSRPAAWSRGSPACSRSGRKSIVGANAFAHGGGIHQDGVLKDRAPTRSCARRISACRHPSGACTSASSLGAPRSTRNSTSWATSLTPDQLARAFPLVKLVLGKKKVLEEMDLRRCAEIGHISYGGRSKRWRWREVSGEK